MASINAIDVVVIGIVLISAGFAMLRGLIHETFAILEWAAGGYVALRFTPVFQPLLNGAIRPAWLEWLLVFIGTFLVVFIPLSIMSYRLSQMVKQSEIGPVDRVLGLIFGAARGLVIVGLAYIAFTALVPLKNHPASLMQARSFPLIRNTGEILRELAPRGIFASNLNASADDTTSSGKTAGARPSGRLDTLLETNGGSGTPSQ